MKVTEAEKQQPEHFEQVMKICIPVHCGARQATQYGCVWEASLVQHNQHGQTNGDSKTLLNSSKHDSQPGSIKHNPVKLVDLHRIEARCEISYNINHSPVKLVDPHTIGSSCGQPALSSIDSTMYSYQTNVQIGC